MTRKIRSIKQVKKRLDLIIKNYGKVILDEGTINTPLTRYVYIEEGFDPIDHQWKPERLYIYGESFKEGKTEDLFAYVTNEKLRKPKIFDDDLEEFCTCYYEKEYPTILNVKEYTFKNWMANVYSL